MQEQIETRQTKPSDQEAAALHQMTLASGLRPWKLRGKEVLPVVQGGMGVGVSAGRLAGTVARCGGMGTISSVDLRRLHPDLMAQTQHLDKEPDARELIEAANRLMFLNS